MSLFASFFVEPAWSRDKSYFLPVVDFFFGDVEVFDVDSFNASVFGVFPVKPQLLSYAFHLVFGGSFDFDERWYPGPGVDCDFSISKLPFFSLGFLIGDEFEFSVFENAAGFIKITDVNRYFFGSMEGAIDKSFVA
ncbi:MAG: hypothetical protein G01um101420_453 [Parcubacteria group bacterium Gr01-1014_20]|nr:MAG: hypothetical protein G01um101420_453 [Parcubacteria group bacterium Gr01-1014_20]